MTALDPGRSWRRRRKTVVKTVVISSRGTTLTSGTLAISYSESWWAAVDSNHVPPRYQHGALPVELAAQTPGTVSTF